MKKAALVAAVVLVVLSAGLFYINRVLLPVQIRGRIVQELQKALNRNVSFGALTFGPIRGLTLTDIVVAEKELPGDPFLRAGKVSVQVLLPALLKKKIIITSLRVDDLSVQAVRTGQDRWNFSDLIASGSPAPETAAPMDVIISGLAVSRATITLTDRAGADATGAPETIGPIDIKGSVSLTGRYRLVLTAAFPSTQGQLTLTAKGHVHDKILQCHANAAHIDTGRYLRYAPPEWHIPLTAMTIAQWESDISMTGTATHVTGKGSLGNINATPAPDTRVRGNAEVSDLRISITPEKTDIAANIAGKGLEVDLPGDRSGGLDFRLPDLRVTLDKNTWTLDASPVLDNVLVVLGPDQRAHTNLSLDRLHLTQKDGALMLSGDVAVNALSAAFGPGQTLAGDIKFDRLSAALRGADITATADIDASRLSTTLPMLKAETALTAPGTSLAVKDGITNISAAPAFQSLTVTTAENMTFTGTPRMTLQAVVPPPDKGNPTYAGTLDLDNGSLTGVPALGSASNIRAALLVDTDRLTINTLTLTLAGAAVGAKGTISRFSSPQLALTATAAGVDLAAAGAALPELMKTYGLTLTGKADVTATIHGTPSDLQAGRGIDIKADLSEVDAASSTYGQRVRGVHGALSYAPDLLTWTNLFAEYQGTVYQLNGRCDNFLEPSLKASVRADGITADLLAKKTGDTVRVEQLTAALFGSTLAASGTITMPAHKPVTLDVAAKGKIDLAALTAALPGDLSTPLKPLGLKGTVTFDTVVQGDPLRWQELSGTVSASAPTLEVMGYRGEQLTFTAEQKNGGIDPFELKARAYSGDISVIGRLDLSASGMPFASTFRLEGLDIEALKEDSPLRDKRVAGRASLTGSLEGKAADLKSITGKAETRMTDGYLWELEVLSKVLRILSSSFQGGDIIVTDASASLNMKDGEITTNNLLLKSPTVSLLGEGSVDILQQTVDMNITPRVEAAPGAGEVNTVLGVINPTEGLMNIHISGPLARPRVEHNISAPTLIKKTIQNTVGGLLKLFE